MDLAEHGTGSLIRALTCLAEAYQRNEEGAGDAQEEVC